MIRRFAVRLGIATMLVVGCATSYLLGRSAAQAPAPRPMLTSQTRGGLRMLLDRAALGGPEVSVGERSYPANYRSAEHSHKSIELLYVLSGEYQHGETHALGAGMLGVVKPGDKVQHKTGGSAAKVLMIWVPGADGDELASGWRSQ